MTSESFVSRISGLALGFRCDEFKFTDALFIAYELFRSTLYILSNKFPFITFISYQQATSGA